MLKIFKRIAKKLIKYYCNPSERDRDIFTKLKDYLVFDNTVQENSSKFRKITVSSILLRYFN